MSVRWVVCVSVVVVVMWMVGLTTAHSWVACTDYTEANGNYWDPAKCRGYARRYSDASGGGVFGADAGFNYQASANAACRDAPRGVTTDYTTQYPMAKYGRGQKVCVAWPSKNHVAATCTNPYIPDGGTQIYRSGPNPTTDPTQDGFKQNLVVDLGAGGGGTINFKGFQNCPKFCENMDKSLCTGCFTVPSDLADGTYTFQWYWIFNAGSAPYTTCWEAQVSGTAGPTTTPTTTPTPDPRKTTTTTQAPTVPAGTPHPLTEDSLFLSAYPVSLPAAAGTFTVKVDYYTAGPRIVTIDVLSEKDFTWYGKGTYTVTTASQGSTTVTVTLQNSPPNGAYILKGWLIAMENADKAQPWLYELNRIENPVLIKDSKYNKETVKQCSKDSDCSDGVCSISGICVDNSGGDGFGAGDAFAIIFALLFVGTLLTLVYMYKFKKFGSASGSGSAYSYRAHSDM